jgi:hypothetical protein
VRITPCGIGDFAHGRLHVSRIKTGMPSVQRAAFIRALNSKAQGPVRTKRLRQPHRSLRVLAMRPTRINLHGFRRREAKLLPGRGVKLPCLSARSQSLVDVAFGSI